MLPLLLARLEHERAIVVLSRLSQGDVVTRACFTDTISPHCSTVTWPPDSSLHLLFSVELIVDSRAYPAHHGNRPAVADGLVSRAVGGRLSSMRHQRPVVGETL